MRHLEQVSEELLHDINEWLVRNVEWPLGTLVTLTGVSLSADLHHLTAKVSVLPIDRWPEVLVVLLQAKREIGQFLFHRLQLFRAPTLRFEQDLGALKEREVERLLTGEQERPALVGRRRRVRRKGMKIKNEK